jgi:hypothetical protein
MHVHGYKRTDYGMPAQERDEPFTVVIDAPNVAYARQNFEGGCFSYHQIDLVVKELHKQVSSMYCASLHV